MDESSAGTPGKSAFDCQRCGQCCQGQGGIVMTPADRERLAQHLGLEVAELLERYAEKSGAKYRLLAGADGFCVFYRAGLGCGVHPGRPDICRAWPYFRGNLLDQVSWEMSREDCKGVSPDVPHHAFVQEGLAYMRAHGLIHAPGLESPSALILGDLLGELPGGGHAEGTTEDGTPADPVGPAGCTP